MTVTLREHHFDMCPFGRQVQRKPQRKAKQHHVCKSLCNGFTSKKHQNTSRIGLFWVVWWFAHNRYKAKSLHLMTRTTTWFNAGTVCIFFCFVPATRVPPKYNSYKLLLTSKDVAISETVWTEWFHWRMLRIMSTCLCLAGSLCQEELLVSGLFWKTAVLACPRKLVNGY